MELLKLIIVKFILGYTLQDLLFIIGICALNKATLERKKFVLISSIFVAITILVRSLPINFGIHTLLIVASIFILLYTIADFDLPRTIRSALIMTILLLASEIIGMGLLIALFSQSKVDALLLDPYYKALMYVPINIIFGIFVFFLYRRRIRKKKS